MSASHEVLIAALTEAVSDLQWIARKWSAAVPDWKDDGVSEALVTIGVNVLRAKDALLSVQQDLGPYLNCKRCLGTGEEPNAQFRCSCRWSNSPLRAAGEPDFPNTGNGRRSR